ncbi:MAG: c-type cytochrome [Chlorobi bacterium]|nr:c-type cytochrome [Chlorobiota bacterium]
MSLFNSFYKYITRSVKEGEVVDKMLDHDYDEIKELDNRMPPWLAAVFIVTTLFACIYFPYYHMLGMGKSSKEEYEEEAAIGDKIKKLHAITDKAKLVTDKTVLSTTKIQFEKLCSPCHGLGAEGKVGPNLTDDYWIHGGDIKNIFNTISEGVPDKGMITWKEQLKPREIEQLASYVISIRGSKPAAPKAPQGNKWSLTDASGHATQLDSTIVKDTINLK